MSSENKAELTNNLLVIKECLIDYVGPLFVFGNIDWLLDGNDITIISATMPKEDFVILNNRVPKWVSDVNLRVDAKNNILIIKDMDKISVERQELLLDILDNNQISSEELPENLKIILNADVKCEVNNKIRDIVECYEL